ncbi:TonB-dependent receptor [Caulobacter sp. RHG1]|uniref:TonB-dependent receptor n=1 Tax=Caulobacter sp. (strain RHG1) TaxID=2545762 RepID=UPI0015578064|nr:TonB-dependent receptor [Caulobacter sp. RHG1]NQE64977.1 TonB-dependent receptor [Caulobacter sp. RHG1]
MKTSLKSRAYLLATAAILATPFTAFAAETAPADATPATAETPDGPTALSDVTVTATRRETKLQETPIAISLLDAKALEARHVQSLMDLADGAIPGLRVATFEARQSALTIGIRGIVPLDANQPAREQGVGVYVDGVYLGRQHGLGAALLDIERLEVLKGPQGTLFGRNTEGGALNMVTRGPTGEFGLRTTAGVGNYGAYNAEMHLDLPSVGDFSFKIDGALQRQNAVTKNPLPGSIGWGAYDRRGLRAQVRWRPTDKFQADLAADIGKDKNTPFYSQLLGYNPNNLVVGPATGTLPAGQIRPLPSIVKSGTDRMSVADIGVPQQWSVDNTNGVSLNLKYEVNDNLELRSITAYREVDVDQWDNSGGAHRIPAYSPNTNFSRYSLAGLWQHQFSQEFQAVGSTDRIDYVAGLYYFHENASDDAATPSTNRWNADGTGYTINDPAPTIRGSRSIDRASRAEAESYAVYGQATYTPAMLDEALHLTVGGRYTWDDKTGQLYMVSNVATNLTFAQKNDRFDPMVTVAYDASSNMHLYAKYSTGYRAGGASSRSLTYRQFGPEEVKAYEIGAKTDLFDRRLRLNVAAFAMDRTGSQIDFSLVTVTGSSTRNTLETINAPGVTKIKGLEVESTLRVTEGLTLSAAYAYTDTKVPPTRNPFSGVVQPVFIVFTPKNAGSVSADYEAPLWNATFRGHVDANYSDATQTFDQTDVKNDKSFIVNARLSLADVQVKEGALLTMSLWSRNLLNEEYVYRRDPANRATLGDYGNFNTPRTYGVEFSVRY